MSSVVNTGNPGTAVRSSLVLTVGTQFNRWRSRNSVSARASESEVSFSDVFSLRLFLGALNFYDGILLGFDWGWRAGRWMRPKKIPIVDRIAIEMLMKRPNLTNETLVKRLDLHKVKLSDKLSPRNKREVKRLLGDDEVVWLWKRALQKKTRIHSVEVALTDFRVEARQYADALWWHKVVIKYYRAHGRLDWARRAAVIKAQGAKEHSKQ